MLRAFGTTAARGAGRRGFGALAVALALALAVPEPTLADPAAALDLYSAAVTPQGGFTLDRPSDRGHLVPAAQIHLDYANDPLIFETARNAADTERTALVSDQLTAHLGVSLGLFDRFLVYAALPVHLVMEGERLGSQPTATGFGAGDLALGGRIGIESGDAALQVTLTLPTGEGGDGAPGVAGDQGPTVEPEFLADVPLGPVHLVLNVGLELRGDTVLAGVKLGDALTYGVGVVVPVAPDFIDVHAEWHGTSLLDDLDARGSSPMEVLAGPKLRAGDQWSLGAAVGIGLTRGYGAPDARGVVTVGWTRERREANAREESPEQESAIAEPEPPPVEEPTQDPAMRDTDGDGFNDQVDRCMDSAGSGDDGCPKEITYEVVPEPLQQQPAAPTPKVPAVIPAPVAAPTVHDDDGDGIKNATDACRIAPGTSDENGCPLGHRIEPGAERFELKKRIRFDKRAAALDAASDAWLTEIAATLRANPGMKVRVESHVAAQENAAASLELTRARAATLRAWFVARGIAAERMLAYGCGQARPIAPNNVPWGQKKNDRVEFVLLDPAPTAGVASAEGCVPSK